MRYATIRRTGRALRFAAVDGGLAKILDGPPWLGGRPTGESEPLGEVQLGCPVAPSKIVGIGRNYAAHARELGNAPPSEPLLFLKPPSALLGPGEAIRLPPESARVEHEAELAVVIGRRAQKVPAAEALSYVFGYACACDVTARDLQRKDVQFTRAKGFDTFCPIGPWIETELDPRGLQIACRVNGQTRQQATTGAMLFDVPTLVTYVSRMMTLEAGDVILTGTPEGVGPIVSGDAVEIEIEKVGVLGLRVES